MKKPVFCVIALVSSAAFLSCNREDGNTAGKGGNATLRITPTHHGASKSIIDFKVYIKYNATDKPSHYDDSASTVQVSGEPVALFTGLKKGNYYIYGYGFDTSIKQNVKGGIPYPVASETTLNIELPVTETHP
jgi:hypothetical protein